MRRMRPRWRQTRLTESCGTPWTGLLHMPTLWERAWKNRWLPHRDWQIWKIIWSLTHWCIRTRAALTMLPTDGPPMPGRVFSIRTACRGRTVSGFFLIRISSRRPWSASMHPFTGRERSWVYCGRLIWRRNICRICLLPHTSARLRRCICVRRRDRWLPAPMAGTMRGIWLRAWQKRA